MTELSDAGWIMIASSALRAAINPFGAELSSLTDAEGREFMTDADPAFWTGRAPVLFPIVGALAHDQYRLGDTAYTLAKHGFARRSQFDVVETGADHALFRLMADAATLAVYPFAFVLDLAFRVEGAMLQAVATVTNPGTEPLPFSLGFHPAFAWPLPGGADKAAHRVTFAESEPAPIRRISPEGLVLPDPFPSPVEGDGFTPAASQFEADAMIWDRLQSRTVTFGPAGGTGVQVHFPDSPMLGIWQKPGAAFLCIEPWQGTADPVGFAGDFRAKPGVVALAPGAARSFRMDVTLVSL